MESSVALTQCCEVTFCDGELAERLSHVALTASNYTGAACGGHNAVWATLVARYVPVDREKHANTVIAYVIYHNVSNFIW